MSPERPATHPDGWDQCAELLAARIQALVDQLTGIGAMVKHGMAADAFGDLGTHLMKVAKMGQRALDAHAQFHGLPCHQVYVDSVIEFMEGLR